MIINHNITALNNYRQLGINQGATAKSMEKLSSGLRINRAGDDAAGLAISEKMRGQIRGLNKASRNAQDAISLIQTAEGALNETHNILQRMRELAVQAANDTNTFSDRNEIQKEINQLTSEINRIGNTTEFNTKKILNGNVGENVNAVRGQFDIVIETSGNAIKSIGGQTVSNNSTIQIGDQTFTYVSGNSSNPTATTGATFHDLTSLADALKNNSKVSEKYDVQITSDGNLRLTQKFGHTGDIQEGAGVAVNGNVVVASGAALTGSANVIVITEGKEAQANQSLKMQIGANQGQSMEVSINDMRAQALGISSVGDAAGFSEIANVTNGTNNNAIERALDVTTHSGASAAITAINNAIEMVSNERSKLGAFQNRLEHTIANLDNSAENLQAAESRIRDVDMAQEIMEFTRSNILSQASQTMLAQANQRPQSVLQLLG